MIAWLGDRSVLARQWRRLTFRCQENPAKTAPMFDCASQTPECLRYNEITPEFREYGCNDS
jgi:hypothetical protein